jgi:hypothetical protein
LAKRLERVSSPRVRTFLTGASRRVKTGSAASLRFHGLRLQEVGMIKSDPNKLIAQGTDWRFLNELKKELKT